MACGFVRNCTLRELPDEFEELALTCPWQQAGVTERPRPSVASAAGLLLPMPLQHEKDAAISWGGSEVNRPCFINSSP